MIRARNLYDPASTIPYRLSRSKIDLYLNCPRCFYLDRRLGVDRPPNFPFTLNNAVDVLLKREFDSYRETQEAHPIFAEFGFEGVPLKHASMEEWRDSLRRGITWQLEGTNIVVTGGVDDVWLNSKTRELHIVDYKATAKNGEITLDAEWQIGYKRQAEIYQWLFRKNGFKVSDTAYFVYCNGLHTKDRFDKRLEFEIKLIPHAGNTDWVESKVREAHQCLGQDTIPDTSKDCEFCDYVKGVSSVLIPR